VVFTRMVWFNRSGFAATLSVPCMIVEAASTDEVAEKLGALPLVREGYLQPPSIVVRRSATLYG
jgi:hypothetical protein